MEQLVIMSCNLFDLTGKTALITGGAGFLGIKHAEAVLEAGGCVLLADIDHEKCSLVAEQLNSQNYKGSVTPLQFDVTKKQEIEEALNDHDTIDILINNADKDPKPHKNSKSMGSGFENLMLETFLSGIETSLI